MFYDPCWVDDVGTEVAWAAVFDVGPARRWMPDDSEAQAVTGGRSINILVVPPDADLRALRAAGRDSLDAD